MKLGKLDRYRVVCGTIDKIIVAEGELNACINVLNHLPPDEVVTHTLNSHFFTVYKCWGYSDGIEHKSTLNTNRVLKAAKWEPCE